MRYRLIAAAALREALAGPRPPTVLDLRSREDYEAGHVPGALHMPAVEMARRRTELPASRIAQIVLVGVPGTRLEAGANWLVLMGYGDVGALEGGIAAWPGDLETGPPPPPPRSGPALRIVPSEEG